MKNINFSKEEYFDKGYAVVDLLENEIIETINFKVEELLKSGNYKENTKIYKYSDGPRIVESWKYINEISYIANDEIIKQALFSLYQRHPLPFSTINFTKGSNQPLHSDYVHFGTKPDGFLCGLWIALEDIKEGSGELQVGEKTNKWPIFKYADYGLKKPTSLNEIKNNYSFYEKWVDDKIKSENISVKSFCLKKGQALLWDFNVLHGGASIKDKSLTRKSLVIHYHFDKTIAYNPNFSFFNGPDDIVVRDFNVIGKEENE